MSLFLGEYLIKILRLQLSFAPAELFKSCSCSSGDWVWCDKGSLMLSKACGVHNCGCNLSLNFETLVFKIILRTCFKFKEMNIKQSFWWTIAAIMWMGCESAPK